MNKITPYKPIHKIRIVTAASLFDGHDAAINIMRRIIQASGVEVIHLGHDRSVEEVVNCAIQEDVNAIAITSYQGGHNEYFKYMFDLLKEKGSSHIKIFGGGGGVILEPTMKKSGIIDSILHMDGSGGDYLIVPGGGSRIPARIKSVNERKHYIKQDGKTVYKYAVKGMADVSEKILSKNNLSGDDIALFIPHQANKRIIDAAAERCGITEDKVLINIDKYGNTTAGTIPIALNEAVNENRINDGDLILLAAFAAGFTWGSILIRWESI